MFVLTDINVLTEIAFLHTAMVYFKWNKTNVDGVGQ